MNQLRTLWQNFNASLWFVPTLMVAAAISRLFPNQLTQAAEPEPAQSLPEPAEVLRSQLVPARATGYVQSLDEEGLLTLARQLAGVVHKEHGIGALVARCSAQVRVARNETSLGSSSTKSKTLQKIRRR
ncbi:hypothetical protein GCM10027511_29490 [Hymenobacter humi]